MKKRALSAILSLPFLLSACSAQKPVNTTVTSVSQATEQTEDVQSLPVVGEMRDISSMELVSEMGKAGTSAIHLMSAMPTGTATAG